jgi:hypothetical protein
VLRVADFRADLDDILPILRILRAQALKRGEPIGSSRAYRRLVELKNRIKRLWRRSWASFHNVPRSSLRLRLRLPGYLRALYLIGNRTEPFMKQGRKLRKRERKEGTVLYETVQYVLFFDGDGAPGRELVNVCGIAPVSGVFGRNVRTVAVPLNSIDVDPVGVLRQRSQDRRFGE